MATTKNENDESELHALNDGEHAVLTGSEEVSVAMRAAPRTGPRFCWPGGVAEFGGAIEARGQVVTVLGQAARKRRA